MAVTTIFPIPDEPVPGEGDPSVFLIGELRRRLDHDRTVQALQALGYPLPTADELAEAAAIRADTVRRQAAGRSSRPLRHW
jgi:hypothetical protein